MLTWAGACGGRRRAHALGEWVDRLWKCGCLGGGHGDASQLRAGCASYLRRQADCSSNGMKINV